MTAILNLAVALLAGLLMTRIFSRWHQPDVTAFLVTGVLIGPYVLGRLGIPGLGFARYDQVEALSMIPMWRWALSPFPSAMNSA